MIVINEIGELKDAHTITAELETQSLVKNCWTAALVKILDKNEIISSAEYLSSELFDTTAHLFVLKI